VTAKAAPVRNSTGGFTKEDFHIDPLALTLRMGLHLYAGELSAVASLSAQVKAVTEATASQLAPYGALLLAGWQGREAEALQVIEATIDEVVPRGEALGLTRAAADALERLTQVTRPCATDWALGIEARCGRC
jgi:hypothetical protein